MTPINPKYAIGPLPNASSTIETLTFLQSCGVRTEKVLTAKNLHLHFNTYPKSILYFIINHRGEWQLNNYDCLPGHLTITSVSKLKEELNT